MTTSAPSLITGSPSPAPLSTSPSEDSPARATVSPGSSSAPTTPDGDGQPSSPSSRRSRRRSSSSRTSPTSCGPVSSLCSKTLPTVGSMRGGVVSQQPPWVRRISAGGSSSLLPTPAASAYGSNQGGAAGRTGPTRPSLASMARHGLWPTPRAMDGARGPDFAQQQRGTKPGHSASVSLVTAVNQDPALWPTPTASIAGRGAWDGGAARNSRPERVRGPLNPAWVEKLMGFPAGWTALGSAASPA